MESVVKNYGACIIQPVYSFREGDEAMRTLTVFVLCLLMVGCASDGAPGAEGPRGQMGFTGERGPKGDKGDRGAAYRPLVWFTCSTVHSFAQVGATNLEYTATVYNNSDVDVDCSAGSGAGQDGSDSMYYPSAVNGANNGYCSASVANGAYWAFTFGESTGPQASYSDGTHGQLDGFVYRFVASDCNCDALGDDGHWAQVMLSDVF